MEKTNEAKDFWRPNTGGDWYAEKLSKPRCVRCGMPATDAVYNSANAHVGNYCRKHSATVLKERKL